MALDMTSFSAALKQLYPVSKIENLVYRDHPLFALLPKMRNFDGETAKIALQYGNSQGRSAIFSTAQANKTNILLKAFILERTKDYSLASIDNETIQASKNNTGAIVAAAQRAIDGAFDSLTRSLATSLFGTGSGSLGQVAADADGTSFELKNINDVVKFEVGMQVVFSATDGGGAVKSGSVAVTSVNRDNGVIGVEVLTGIAGGAGVLENDFVFVQGDYDRKIKGLRAWLPDVAPSAGDMFFGVDRSIDPTRLAGVRYDGSAESIEEALIGAASRLAREGGRPDTCIMDYSKFANLEKALGSKVQYVDLKATADIGFRGMQVHGPKGTIKIIADQDCPSDRAFLLQVDTWSLMSLGNCPQLLNSDGNNMLRDSNSDSVEIRTGYYANLACTAPGYNCNIKLD